MGYTKYVVASIKEVSAVYSSLALKKTSLSVHDYKILLNDYYLKYFGFDRRAGKMMTTDYVKSSYCTEEPFHVDKCLLLACLIMEDVKLSEKKEEQRYLLDKVLFLYNSFLARYPELKFEPLEQELSSYYT